MVVWDVHYLERERTEIGKDSMAKRPGGELGGTYGCIYRPSKMNRGFESWLWIVAHIPRKLEGGKVSLASPSAGRLEF
jgi:hypothetical protein